MTFSKEMKKFTLKRKFTVALCLVICAAIVGGWADRRWNSYRLHFIDSATHQPFVDRTFLLVPRIIITKGSPGDSTGDPNLKYAKSITTDSNGYAILEKSLIDDLTHKGRVYVDCQSQGSARFCLRRKSPITFLGVDNITVFNIYNVVSYQMPLSSFHDNLLLLDKSSIPPTTETATSQ